MQIQSCESTELFIQIQPFSVDKNTVQQCDCSQGLITTTQLAQPHIQQETTNTASDPAMAQTRHTKKRWNYLKFFVILETSIFAIFCYGNIKVLLLGPIRETFIITVLEVITRTFTLCLVLQIHVIISIRSQWNRNLNYSWQTSAIWTSKYPIICLKQVARMF